MRYSNRNMVLKRPYSKISLKKRQQLVKCILQEGLPISKAGKKMKIKLTTARLILKKYKETGTFPMKRFKENDSLLQNATHRLSQIPQIFSERSIAQEGAQCQKDNFIPQILTQTNIQPFLQCTQPIFYYFWQFGSQEFSYY